MKALVIDEKKLAAFLGERPKFYRDTHAKTCRCNLCVREKLSAYEERVKMAVRGGARIESADQTVPVRSHFRAQMNHLKRDPALRALVREVVLGILREQRKGTH